MKLPLYSSGDASRLGLPVVTLAVLSLATPVGPAVSETRTVETAVVRPLDGAPDGPPMFTFERVTTSDGTERVVHVRFTTAAAEPALHEIVTYRDGRVVRYESIQQQIGERATLTVHGDRAVIERVTGDDGRTSRSEHDWTDDTLTIDEIADHVRAHWNELRRGGEIRFRLVAVDRGRIVGFKVTERASSDRAGRPVVLFRMEATSVFVRWLAPEIDLIFTEDAPHDLVESAGLLPVKVRRDGAWKDTEGRIVWDR